VLLISTDPASKLDEVLGVAFGTTPTAVPGVPNLKAMNIDPEASAKAYRESMVAPYRGVLPDAAVASMEEQFSGSCTLEIAAFDEFARLLGGPGTKADSDHVLFDTAPTGHTLPLLSLPSAWDGFLSKNTTGTSCLGPLAGLQAQHRPRVVMALQPEGEIGADVRHLDPFFRVEGGTGEAVRDGGRAAVRAGFAVLVPAGTDHNTLDTGSVPLKLHTIHAPPNQRDGVIRHTRAEAEADDEPVDGTTTEP
jgi:mannose-6-phosphate isomerase-like protein (cupin superfamily)